MIIPGVDNTIDRGSLGTQDRCGRSRPAHLRNLSKELWAISQPDPAAKKCASTHLHYGNCPLIKESISAIPRIRRGLHLSWMHTVITDSYLAARSRNLTSDNVVGTLHACSLEFQPRVFAFCKDQSGKTLRLYGCPPYQPRFRYSPSGMS